jgi:hypothetical protein
MLWKPARCEKFNLPDGRTGKPTLTNVVLALVLSDHLKRQFG